VTGDDDGQTTLEGFDSDDDERADDLDDLRAEVDQLKGMMETLVETHQDLADTVATLADGPDERDATGEPTDTVDAGDAVEDTDDPRGFQ
jgi:uncharacterized membrane protein YdfJ with MMPL/SSD domain